MKVRSLVKITSIVKGSNKMYVCVFGISLGQYCAIDDEEVIQTGIEKVKGVIRDNYVHRSDSEIVKAKIGIVEAIKLSIKFWCR